MFGSQELGGRRCVCARGSRAMTDRIVHVSTPTTLVGAPRILATPLKAQVRWNIDQINNADQLSGAPRAARPVSSTATLALGFGARRRRSASTSCEIRRVIMRDMH
jgi:hypothetical protein